MSREKDLKEGSTPLREDRLQPSPETLRKGIGAFSAQPRKNDPRQPEVSKPAGKQTAGKQFAVIKTSKKSSHQQPMGTPSGAAQGKPHPSKVLSGCGQVTDASSPTLHTWLDQPTAEDPYAGLSKKT